MSKEILILDIETTGFLNKGGKIVEIGMVSLDLDSGEITKVIDEVVYEKGITKEEVESSWIVQNSSLTVEMVQHGLRLDRIKNMIQALIVAYPNGCTAFNNAFDFGFMEDRGFKFPKKLDCPMLLSKDILKLPGKYGDFKWPKVTEAYAYFFPEVDYDEEHRGFSDAYDEAKIVYELYNRGIFKVD